MVIVGRRNFSKNSEMSRIITTDWENLYSRPSLLVGNYSRAHIALVLTINRCNRMLTSCRSITNNRVPRQTQNVSPVRT